MANHKSSLKRIRQDKVKTLHNKYYAKTMRNAVRKLRAMTDKDEAVKLYPEVQKMVDKLAKTNVIHKNKAANLKSSLCKHIGKLALVHLTTQHTKVTFRKKCNLLRFHPPQSLPTLTQHSASPCLQADESSQVRRRQTLATG